MWCHAWQNSYQNHFETRIKPILGVEGVYVSGFTVEGGDFSGVHGPLLFFLIFFVDCNATYDKIAIKII